MKRIASIIALLLLPLLMVAATYTVESVPNVHLSDSTRFVSDPDGILSPGALAQADAIMKNIRRTSTAEPVVVLVDDIEGGDYDTFATELFEKWGLGKSDLDNGLLILVVKNLHRVVIRTGYGLEGVLPDIVCGTIIREYMAPAFKKDDFDGGVLAASSKIAEVLTDENALAEIRSKEADADFARHNSDSDDLSEFFHGYFAVALCLALIMLGVFIMEVYRNRHLSGHAKYVQLNNIKPVYLALTFFGLGIPLLASLPLIIYMRRLREKPRICPHCKAKMTKVDEVHDNDYLNRGQDLEEQLGSVDYDVWLCPSCGETDIEPYINPHSSYHRCEKCGSYTSRLDRDRVLRQPSTLYAGEGVKEYACLNCGHINRVPYSIPKIVVIPTGGGGGRGGFGGGGFGGGGFGGGSTGGGGASGGW